MIIDSKQFLREIKTAKNFLPVYLIIGEEETLLSDCLKSLQSAFFARYGNEFPDFNSDHLYADKIEAGKIVESCSTLPFGSEKKLVVVHYLEKLNDSAKSLLKDYCGVPNPSTSLVLLWNVKPNQTTLNHAIAEISVKAGVLVKCWKPFEEQRPQWIVEEVAKSAKTISREASILLSQESGDSLAELKSEIEKLVLLTGDRKQIALEDVKQSMSFRRNRSVWDLIENMESGDVRKAGQILEHCLEQGEEPIMILSLIARSLRKGEQEGSGSFYGSAFNKKPRKPIPENRLPLLFNEMKKADLILKSGHGIESAAFEKLLTKLRS